MCETVKAKALTLFQCNGPEDNWGIPPELITGVRILASLGKLLKGTATSHN